MPADRGNTVNRQERAALALAAGQSVERAATDASVSSRQVRRWRQLPEFLARVQELRSEMHATTSARLGAGGKKAVRTLVLLLGSPNDSVRLGAAKGILELSFRARELVDLASQISDLKRQLLPGASS